MMFDGRDTRLCRHPPPVHVRSGDAHALERFRQWARQAASICSSAQASSAIWLWSPAPMPWFLLIALSFFSAVAFGPWWTVLVGPILIPTLRVCVALEHGPQKGALVAHDTPGLLSDAVGGHEV